MSAGKDVEKREPSRIAGGMQTGTATVGLPQKTKNGTAF